MTMEVILSTAFGRAVDVQGGKGGKLFESAVAVFAAITPPKENDPVKIFRILQLSLCKVYLFSAADRCIQRGTLGCCENHKH